MTIAGEFTPVTEKEGVYRGFLLGYPHQLVIEPLELAGTETANGKIVPDSRVFTVLPDSNLYDVGSVKNHVARNGKPYMEMTLHRLGAMYPQPVYVNLYHSDKKEGALIAAYETAREKMDNRKKYEQTKAANLAVAM